MLIKDETISDKNPILIRVPKGDVKVTRIRPSETIRLGKIRIPVKELIGKKYGSTFNHLPGARDWTRTQRSALVGASDVMGEEEMEVNRESSSDEQEGETQHVGHLRAMESALGNDAFLFKTRFSQEKYLRKKYHKYAKEITILKPTVADFCEANATEIREDMLGSLLRFSGVCHGSRVAVVDDVAGILTASLLLRGCYVDRYVYGKSTGQERGLHLFGVEKSDKMVSIRDPPTIPIGKSYESVIVASNGSSEFDFDSLFKEFEPHLRVSGNIVFYARNIEPLLKLLYELRTEPDEEDSTKFLNVQLTEQMFREQEIIKERTHPVMQQSINLFKGFILSAIKVNA